jgi:hypothetical protein
MPARLDGNPKIFKTSVGQLTSNLALHPKWIIMLRFCPCQLAEDKIWLSFKPLEKPG